MNFIEARVVIDNTDIYLNEFSSFDELSEHIEENHPLTDLSDWTELEYEDLHSNFIETDGIKEAYWDIIQSLNEVELPMIVDFMDNEESYYGNYTDELLRNFEETEKYVDMDTFTEIVFSEFINIPDHLRNIFDFDKFWNSELSYDYWESPNGYVFRK